MGIEIERKFLLKTSDWRSKVKNEIEIKQGYLNSDKNRVVRIRTNGEIGIITIKGKTNKLTRKEYEYEIPIFEAQELLKLCEQPIIEKIRHIIKHKNKIWEVDEFKGENQGLVVAEIELKEESEKVELPNWIGKEVTFDSKYFNSNLISNPYKIWKKK